MPKEDSAFPKEKLVTLTQEELDSRLAAAAASAAILRERGSVAHEQKVMSQERRVSEITGIPVPDRKPWGMETATAKYKDYLMAGPVECALRIQVKDRDLEGEPISPPIRKIVECLVTKFPSVEDMCRKFGMPVDAATTLTGGRERQDIQPGVKFTVKFLQEVSNAYEKPARAVFQGQYLEDVKMHLTSDPKPVPLGEVRRGGNW